MAADLRPPALEAHVAFGENMRTCSGAVADTACSAATVSHSSVTMASLAVCRQCRGTRGVLTSLPLPW
jgi:hypothetical protein